MALLRPALTALTFLLLLSGCTGSTVHRNLVQALAELGCAGAPAVDYQHLGSRVVLSVSVQECVDVHPRRTGEVVEHADAARTMGWAIWSTQAYWFDSVMVTVYRTAGEPRRTRPQSVLIDRDQLAAEFGPRDPALDSSLPHDDIGSAAWSYLPPLAAVGGMLVLVAVARAIRAGNVVPVMIIRR